MNIISQRNRQSLAIKPTKGSIVVVSGNLDTNSDTDDQSKGFEDDLPEGGYGWVVVGCCFFFNFVGFGMGNAYGVFLQYYTSSNKFPGYDSLAISAVGGIAIGFTFILGPIVNILISRVGVKVGNPNPSNIAFDHNSLITIKIPLLIGVLFTCLGLQLASFAQSFWELFMSQGVLFGLGASLSFIPSISIPSQYFYRKRALATGIAASGSGIGGFILAPVARILINDVGVAWALRILGFLCLCLGLPAVLLVKDRRHIQDLRYVSFDIKLLKQHPAFCFYLAFGFIHLWGYIVPFFLLPSYVVKLGFSASIASWLVGIMSGINAIGRILLGLVADKLGRINLLILALTIAGFSQLLIWEFSENLGLMIFFVVIFGLFSGAYWALGVPAAAEIVGLKDLGSALSLLYLCNLVPPIVSPTVTFSIANVTPENPGKPYQEFKYSILFSGLMMLSGCLILLVARQIRTNGKVLVKI